ncbi:hypothetical protein L6164_028485 [Bauhinia variegata]|uniref:Uncharacterized protein n=1 Tax=Bauhinia variegata TaxID=167791 RepID=A0ACB9L5S6_BAUVA|nr:hypothetical protein L6164_028485 [Bauhinia variegata]
MAQSLCNFPTQTRPQNTLLQSEALAFSSTSTKQTMNKFSTLDQIDAKEMDEYTPVEIGTRGTVGSLVLQEIEYFNRLELNSQDRPRESKSQITDMGSSGSTNSRATSGSTAASTKKKRASSKFLPSMCSMVDVSDKNKPNGTSVFSYRNLKSDTKNMHV